MLTTSHTSNLGRTITFTVESIQYQMTILTPATDMLISVPVINMSHMSQHLVRHPNIQHKTIHLVLATLALKRQHIIWFIFNVTPSPPATLIDQVKPLNDSTSIACAPPAPSLSQPVLSSTHQLITAQLLLPPLLNDGTSKRGPSTVQNHTQSSICPRPAKRYKTPPSWPNHNRG